MLEKLYVLPITLLGIIIGGLLTGLFAVINSYYQAITVNEREKNKLILGKLEELFSAIDKFRIYYTTSFFTFHRYLIGTEALPIVAPVDEDASGIQILGLATFYAPSLETKVGELLNEIGKFTIFQNEVLTSIKSGKNTNQTENDRILTLGQNVVRNISNSCLMLQKEVAALSKEYLK